MQYVDDNFVEVVVIATGEKTFIPQAWLDHPGLSGPFKLPPSARTDWKDQKIGALNAEIDSRNEGRDDDHQIVPASRKKDDLVAALELDDETSAVEDPPTPDADQAADKTPAAGD